ncbi:hypothetical protein ACP70R_020962 [Stipagrostis hirtigluma subsp. patula]
MAVSFPTYKTVYRKCDSRGKFLVIDRNEIHEDYNGVSSGLYKGKYSMIVKESSAKKDLSQDCLIKKCRPDRSKLKCYSLLKNIRHPSIVSIKNFYDDNGPRFILSWVDGSISAWSKGTGAGKLVKSSRQGSLPSPMFRQIIIDLCSGLEHLFSEGIYPNKISIKDIFMQTIGRKDFAKLLICEAQKLAGNGGAIRENKLWSELKNAMRKLFIKCNIHPGIHPIADRFFNYIGKCSARVLERYPVAWNDKQKAKYLLWVMSLDKAVVWPKVQNVGLSWPVTSCSNLPPLLREMIRHDNARKNRSCYNTGDPYDYLLVCKNLIKHWLVLPESVKINVLTGRELCKEWMDGIQKSGASYMRYLDDGPRDLKFEDGDWKSRTNEEFNENEYNV